jgi:hypothetical protein
MSWRTRNLDAVCKRVRPDRQAELPDAGPSDAAPHGQNVRGWPRKRIYPGANEVRNELVARSL